MKLVETVKEVTLIIPAYNEEGRIERAASRIFSSPYLKKTCKFLFVVDGEDCTYEILEKIKKKNPKTEILLKKYPKRLGKGGAVSEGILDAKTEYVGFLDVDMSISVGQIEEIVKTLLKHKLDCIIGIRKGVEGAPPLRRISSLAFNSIVNLLFGLGISDTQCGCKFFRKKLVYNEEGKIFKINGFAFDVELLDKIQKNGGKITGHSIASKWEGGKFSLFESPKMLLDLIFLRMF